MVENRTPQKDPFAYLFRPGHADTKGTVSGLPDDTMAQIVSETLMFPASTAAELPQAFPAQPYGVGSELRHRRGRGLTYVALLVLGAVLGAGGAIVAGSALDSSQVAVSTTAPEAIPTTPEVIPCKHSASNRSVIDPASP